MFFECMTYRWMEHVGPNQDYHAGYRSKIEAEPWMQNDQVEVIGQLVEAGKREQIQREVEAEVAAAFEFAEQSPFPAEEELLTDLFKET
jgi:TPP-dependent pyruvate/acetoin dehydrogenase alpha subunit